MRQSISTTKDKKSSTKINKPVNTHKSKENALAGIQSIYSRIPSAVQSYADRLRPFIKPTAYAFAILLIATFAIWRTSLPYIDDLNRDYNGGYAFSYSFARYSPSLLMYFLNMDFTLQNLSPLTQILAMLFVAIACVMITYILCNRKIRYLPLTLSTLIAINPLALGCWMFQYDAPGMALSILSATFPILYWYKLNDLFSSDVTRKQKHHLAVKFIVISSLSLLVMWTSYQASSGLLPLLILTACFIDILQNNRIKPTLLKALFYIVPYLIAATLFLAIYNLSSLNNYRDASAAPMNNLLSTVANNLNLYLSTTWQHLNGSWRILVVLLASSLIVASLLAAKKRIHLIRNSTLSVLYLTITLPISYGAYLLLNSPASKYGAVTTFGRTAIGLGFVVALACIAIAALVKRHSIITHVLYLPGFVLLIAFISYNSAFANAYDDQLRYIQFRAQEVVEDVADIYPDKKSLNKRRISIYNTIGYSREMSKLIKAHPMAKLISNDIDKWLLPVHFGRALNFSSDIGWRWGGHYKKECMSSPAKNSTYYHTVREKSNGDLCVYLK